MRKRKALAPLRWDDVRVLLALLRAGSQKQAARALGVDIATVSRRLGALEAALGATLFERTPDGTRPTEAAARLAPLAEKMERAAEGVTRGLEGLEAEPEGLVRVTAPPGLVDHFLAPELVSLTAAFPRLRVEILSSIAYADLARREADLALRLTRPARGDFVSTRLSSEGWEVIASPAHAHALGRLEDPARTSWVTWGDDLAHLPDGAWIRARVPEGRIQLVTNSMTAQLEAVRAGFGVMLAPRPYGALRGLTVVDVSAALRRSLDALPEGTLFLVATRAAREVPRVSAVWSWLVARFRR